MPRALTFTACCCAAIALAACGDSQPDYCKERAKLGQQIDQLRGTNVLQEGTNTLRSRITATLTQTEKLAEDAKSDFPSETRDLDVASDALKTSLRGLQSPDTRRSALVRLPGQLQATADAAKRLQTAVEDKCS